MYPGNPAIVFWVTCSHVGGVFVGRPSYLHHVVATIGGHDTMYYLNIVLKWEEWLTIPEGTAGWSADVSIRSRPSLG